MMWLWWLLAAGQLVLLVRWWRAGLWRSYPVLVGWVAFELLRAAALWPLGFNTPAYRTLFLVTAPLVMLAQCAVVAEWLREVLADYPGAARSAPRLLLGVAGVSLVLVIATAAPDLALLKRGAWVMIAQRYVATGLALVAGAVAAFFGVFPSKARRWNVILHGRILVSYLVAVAVAYEVYNATNGTTRAWVNMGLLVVTNGAVWGWAVAMSRVGEQRAEVPAADGAAARARLVDYAEAAARVWSGR